MTYSNIEIILVDDGSTGSIREKFVTSMLRRSYSSFSRYRARNIGVQQASSDWIMFLDADDYYNTKAAEYLVALKDQYGVDLVVTSIRSAITRLIDRRVRKPDRHSPSYVWQQRRNSSWRKLCKSRSSKWRTKRTKTRCA